MTDREIIKWNQRGRNYDPSTREIFRIKLLLKKALKQDPHFEEKFEHYRSFLTKLSFSSKFYYSYLARRFAMVAALIVGSVLTPFF